MKEYGKKVWIFPDAELPPEGVDLIPGHESVIITNVTDQKATVTITLLYEQREPVSFPVTVEALFPGHGLFCLSGGDWHVKKCAEGFASGLIPRQLHYFA